MARNVTVQRIVIGGLLAAGIAGAGDQPQWGQAWTRNMVSAETGLPADFDPETGRNVKWQAKMGDHTYGSPVIASGRVLIGTDNEVPRDARRVGDRGILMCLDEQDGSLLWQLVVPKLTTSKMWDWPRAGLCSPSTVEGERVYVVSNRGEVMCLDLNGLADGNDGPFQDEARHAVPDGQPDVPLGPLDADILWLFDMVKELGVRQHDSAHASILINGPYLYLNTSNGVDDSHAVREAPQAPSLVVVDKQTGRLIATDGQDIGPRVFHCTWSSPSLMESADGQAVVFGGGDGVVYGLRPLESARVRREDLPLRLEQAWAYDADPDGPKSDVGSYLKNREVSPSTIMGMVVPHDGRVYFATGGDYWWGKRQAWLHCLEPGTPSPSLRWSYALNRHTMCTPTIHDGLVYATDCGKTVHCVDADSGKRNWALSTRGEIWSSPFVADGKVYVTTQRGEIICLAADRTLKEVGRTEIRLPISATPVAANGVLYIATPEMLFALAAESP